MEQVLKLLGSDAHCIRKTDFFRRFRVIIGLQLTLFIFAFMVLFYRLKIKNI